MPTWEASARRSAAVKLEDRGAAPEIDNPVWLNVAQPLRIRELEGSGMNDNQSKVWL
jgi:hypothetical protein